MIAFWSDIEYLSNIFRNFCSFHKRKLVVLFNGFQKHVLIPKPFGKIIISVYSSVSEKWPNSSHLFGSLFINFNYLSLFFYLASLP